MVNLKGKSVLVTGATGMLGKHLQLPLMQTGATLISIGKANFDLTKSDECDRCFKGCKPDYCLHLAGFNGGILFNKEHPAQIFHQNTLMGLNVIESARKYGVKKLISVIASCAYPDMGTSLLKEKDLWNGPPNPTVSCHGLAKRLLDAYSQFAFREYTFPAYTVVLPNLYGPYDRFDLKRGKVVASLIRKFVEAKQGNIPLVECLGTGKPKRDFLYVEDAARLLVWALENYEENSLPLNLGCGQDFSIKKLAVLIKKLTGYRGKIVWNTESPDGQMRKMLDVTRMRNLIGLYGFTPLEEGLQKTIDWYYKNHYKQTCINKLTDILVKGANSQIMDIVWGPDTETEEVYDRIIV